MAIGIIPIGPEEEEMADPWENGWLHNDGDFKTAVRYSFHIVSQNNKNLENSMAEIDKKIERMFTVLDKQNDRITSIEKNCIAEKAMANAKAEVHEENALDNRAVRTENVKGSWMLKVALISGVVAIITSLSCDEITSAVKNMFGW